MATLLKRSVMRVPNWPTLATIFPVAIVLLLFAATVTMLAAMVLLDFSAQEVTGACVCLLIMIYGAFEHCRDSGGFREAVLDFLELFAWWQFVECLPGACGEVEVRFGFNMFGLRVLHLRVAVDKISIVELRVVQGRWILLVRYDYDDLEPTHRRQSARLLSPGVGMYQLGRDMRWRNVDVLGRSLVRLLRDAGAKLSRTNNRYAWVRMPLQTEEGMKEQT